MAHMLKKTGTIDEKVGGAVEPTLLAFFAPGSCARQWWGKIQRPALYCHVMLAPARLPARLPCLLPQEPQPADLLPPASLRLCSCWLRSMA